jgi:hypothetical protein
MSMNSSSSITQSLDASLDQATVKERKVRSEEPQALLRTYTIR